MFILNPLSSIIGDQKTLLPYFEDNLPIIESYHIENLERISLYKDDYVIKPSSGYGGFGVTIGKECNDIEWQDVLKNADNHIAQNFYTPDIYYREE